MKNTLKYLLPIVTLLCASCGMDNGTPSSLDSSMGSIAPVTGDATVRIKPASFGMYDQYINPHPEERRTSLYRLYKKEGRNYLYQSDGAQELKLNTIINDTAVQIILYKERISTSSVGDFKYYEMIDGSYQQVDTTVSEFRAIQQGDDESSAQLIFKMRTATQEGNEDREFKLSVQDDKLIYSHLIQLDDQEEPEEVFSDVTVETEDVAEITALGTYINDVMMSKSGCKRVTAGNIVGITNYTTDAERGLEYRKCYWDLYDKVVRDFIKAHKDAVTAGDSRGEKCIGSSFTAIKKELKEGKNNCQAQFGN